MVIDRPVFSAENDLKVYISCGVAITIKQLHSKMPELGFYAVSNPACGVSEIRNGENP